MNSVYQKAAYNQRGIYRPFRKFEKDKIHQFTRERGVYLKTRLDYGYTVRQTLGCLRRCWLGYKIAKQQETIDDEKMWANFIRKLQYHLGMKDLEHFDCLTEEENKDMIMTSIAERFAPELMKLPTDHLEKLYEHFRNNEINEYGESGYL